MFCCVCYGFGGLFWCLIWVFVRVSFFGVSFGLGMGGVCVLIWGVWFGIVCGLFWFVCFCLVLVGACVVGMFVWLGVAEVAVFCVGFGFLLMFLWFLWVFFGFVFVFFVGFLWLLFWFFGFFFGCFGFPGICVKILSCACCL